MSDRVQAERMWKFVQNPWVVVTGFVIGFPGYVGDAHIWLEWLGLTRGIYPIIAASIGSTIIALWFLAKAHALLQPRLRVMKFRKAVVSCDVMQEPVRVNRALLITKLAKFGIGGPSHRASDEEWKNYHELMQFYSRTGKIEDARELGKKITASRNKNGEDS